MFDCHHASMEQESIEGWYSDPYERHEARWMSEGTPTQLIRDGDVEGDDPVMDEPFKVTPVRFEMDENSPHDASDLRRADEAQEESPFHPKDPARAAFDVYEQSGLGGNPSQVQHRPGD
jgi:hypothetical protein